MNPSSPSQDRVDNLQASAANTTPAEGTEPLEGLWRLFEPQASSASDDPLVDIRWLFTPATADHPESEDDAPINDIHRLFETSAQRIHSLYGDHLLTVSELEALLHEDDSDPDTKTAIDQLLTRNYKAVQNYLEGCLVLGFETDARAALARLPEGFRFETGYLWTPVDEPPTQPSLIQKIKNWLRTVDAAGVSYDRHCRSVYFESPLRTVIFYHNGLPDAPRFQEPSRPDAPKSGSELLARYYAREKANLTPMDLHHLIEEPLASEEARQTAAYIMAHRGAQGRSWGELKAIYTHHGMGAQIAHGESLLKQHAADKKHREASAAATALAARMERASSLRSRKVADFHYANNTRGLCDVKVENWFGRRYLKISNWSDQPMTFYSRWEDVNNPTPSPVLRDAIGLPYTAHAIVVAPECDCRLPTGDALFLDENGKYSAEGFFGVAPVTRQQALGGLVTAGLTNIPTSVENDEHNTTIKVRINRHKAKHLLEFGDDIHEGLKRYVLKVVMEEGREEIFSLRHEQDLISWADSKSDGAGPFIELCLHYAHAGQPLTGAIATADLFHESEQEVSVIPVPIKTYPEGF